MSETFETIPTERGIRLVQHDVVLSEVLNSPGPTHSVADVIAAAMMIRGSEGRMALLGFAGGGLIAPLRAMGGQHRVDAVDLDVSGYTIFKRHCHAWAGPVTFHKGEACQWMRKSRHCFDVIVEDLSVPVDDDVFKPEVTWTELPELIYRRLAPDGVAVLNLLHPGNVSWQTGITSVVGHGMSSRIIHIEEFENRVVVVGKTLPTARKLSSELRRRLQGINSHLAAQISVQTLVD